jgi:hypothetical protein
MTLVALKLPVGGKIPVVRYDHCKIHNVSFTIVIGSNNATQCLVTIVNVACYFGCLSGKKPGCKSSNATFSGIPYGGFTLSMLVSFKLPASVTTSLINDTSFAFNKLPKVMQSSIFTQ